MATKKLSAAVKAAKKKKVGSFCKGFDTKAAYEKDRREKRKAEQSPENKSEKAKGWEKEGISFKTFTFPNTFSGDLLKEMELHRNGAVKAIGDVVSSFCKGNEAREIECIDALLSLRNSLIKKVGDNHTQQENDLASRKNVLNSKK